MIVMAVLQARMSSTRFPGKVLRPILGQPMLLRQIERVRRARSLSHLVVATSISPSDQDIADVCKSQSISCFRGSLDDVLDRVYQAAKPFKPDYVVRLTGDCPLVDPEILDQAVRLCIEGKYDYLSNALHPTYPDGLDVEVIRWTVLEKAWSEAQKPSEREHVTPFIHQQPSRFRLGEQRSPVDYSRLRWTVDEPVDFKLVSKIFEDLYPVKPSFQTKDVLDYLATHPELNALNAHLERNMGYRQSLSREAGTEIKPNV